MWQRVTSFFVGAYLSLRPLSCQLSDESALWTVMGGGGLSMSETRSSSTTRAVPTMYNDHAMLSVSECYCSSSSCSATAVDTPSIAIRAAAVIGGCGWDRFGSAIVAVQHTSRRGSPGHRRASQILFAAAGA
jgi:hypothetical protein